MALKGSLNSSTYQGRGIRFEWEATQSIPNNTSTINWKLTGYGEGASSWYYAGPFEVVIDGKKTEIKERIQLHKDTVIKTGSLNINHNTNGTRDFAVNIKAAIYSGSYNESGSTTFRLDTIPRAAVITSAPNFNDEQNPTIKISNPLGNNVNKLEVGLFFKTATETIAIVPYTTISPSTTSYTFNLDPHRTEIWNRTKALKSRTVYFYIKTTIGQKVFYNNVAKTLTIVNSEPKCDASVVEADPVLSQLFSTEPVFIKGFSDAKVNLTAIPQKASTIKSYLIINGGQSSPTSAKTFENINSGAFGYKVVDSRGNQYAFSQAYPIVNYFIPFASLSAKATLDTDQTARVDLSVSGKWFNGIFNSIVKNKLTVEYSVVKEGEKEIWKPLTVSSNGNQFTGSSFVTGLDYLNAYSVSIRIKDTIYDAYGKYRQTSKTVKAFPIFDWGEDGFNFNIPVSFKGETMSDMVVQNGGISGWRFRKWKSGTLEAWNISARKNISINKPYGSLFYNNDIINIPNLFSAIHHINVSSYSLTGLPSVVVNNFTLDTVNISVSSPKNETISVGYMTYIIGTGIKE